MLKFLISTLINRLNAQHRKRSPTIGSATMYASGRYRRPYSIGIKDARFPSRRRPGFSSSHSRATRPWSVCCRDICVTKSLRRDNCGIKILRRGTLHCQLRPAGECCINKFSLAAMSPAVVLCARSGRARGAAVLALILWRQAGTSSWCQRLVFESFGGLEEAKTCSQCP